MTPFEQSVWVAVFAGECVARNLTQGAYDVAPAVKAADHAVADLARYRREEAAAQSGRAVPAEQPLATAARASLDEQRKGKRQ